MKRAYKRPSGPAIVMYCLITVAVGRDYGIYDRVSFMAASHFWEYHKAVPHPLWAVVVPRKKA